MRWRGVWLRSRLTAIVVSGLVWLIVASLTPLVAAGYAVVGALVVAGWRTRLLRWLRYGTRPVAPVEAEAVWRALVPMVGLRGRNQPRLSSGTRLNTDMVAADLGQLVLSDRLLQRITQHTVPDDEVRRLIVRALATAGVNRSRLVAAVGVFCLPWSLLAVIARTMARPLVALGLPVLAWRARWLFIGLAVADLYGRAHWSGLVMLLLAAVATVTTPRWNRAWTAHQIAMADGPESAPRPDRAPRPDSTGPEYPARPATSPATPRGGDR